MKGSSGICETSASMSARVRAWAPRTNPPIPVPIEEPSWYHRRVLRSLKNVFQSRWSVGCGLVVVVSWGGGVLIEDACRVEIIDVEGLNTTLRLAFVRGTRRLGWEEDSVDRRWGGEVVW